MGFIIFSFQYIENVNNDELLEVKIEEIEEEIASVMYPRSRSTKFNLVISDHFFQKIFFRFGFVNELLIKKKH